MFIGLWNFCDDCGRHAFRAKQIKAEIFPGDDFTESDILGMLSELSENGLINVYVVENKEYLEVTGWHNQRIDKPQPAKHPEPFQDDSKNVPRTFPPDSIGKDSIVKKEHMSDSDEPDDGFEMLWREKPKRPNQSKPDARKAYNARIREGTPHADLLAGLRRYNEFCRLEETEPRYCKHLATFLGPGEHWKKPWKSKGKVPTDEAGIMRLVQSENIQLAPNCPTHEARKAIAKQLGMAL